MVRDEQDHVSYEYARELLAKHHVRSGEPVLKRLSKDDLASFAEILGIEFERGQKKADLVRLLMQSREMGVKGRSRLLLPDPQPRLLIGHSNSGRSGAALVLLAFSGG